MHVWIYRYGRIPFYTGQLLEAMVLSGFLKPDEKRMQKFTKQTKIILDNLERGGIINIIERKRGPNGNLYELNTNSPLFYDL